MSKAVGRVLTGAPDDFDAVLDLVGDARFVLLGEATHGTHRPETERHSHYFHARLTQQFDGVLYYDTTRAVEPLERTGLWERGEVAETFPSAL
jgi:erythromycin esterase-like protein